MAACGVVDHNSPSKNQTAVANREETVQIKKSYRGNKKQLVQTILTKTFSRTEGAADQCEKT